MCVVYSEVVKEDECLALEHARAKGFEEVNEVVSLDRHVSLQTCNYAPLKINRCNDCYAFEAYLFFVDLQRARCHLLSHSI